MYSVIYILQYAVVYSVIIYILPYAKYIIKVVMSTPYIKVIKLKWFYVMILKLQI